MNGYKVTAKVTFDLETFIKANSLEEAQQIADYELLTDDFTKVDGVFTLGTVEEK